MNNNKKRIYTFGGNLLFYFGIWQKTYPAFILLLGLAVPSGILAAYATATLPKLIVQGIEQQQAIGAVLKPLLGTSLAMVVFNAVSSYSAMRFMEKGILPKTYLNANIVFKKITTLSYNRLVTADTQDQIAKVKEIMSEGDKGTMHQFGRSLALLLTSLFGIVFFAVDIVKIDGVLLGVILVTSAANAFYGFWNNRRQSDNMSARSRSAKQATAMSSHLQDRAFYKDMRLYHMAPWLIERLEAYVSDWSHYIKQSTALHFGASVVNALMFFIRELAVIIYLVISLLEGAIGVAHFVYMLALVRTFSTWVNELIQQVNKLMLFSLSMGHIRALLDIETEESAAGQRPLIVHAPEIRIEGLGYRYPESSKWLFRDFSLTIGKGESLALVGNNGAGKTTLMLLLMGLLTPCEGRIFIDGIDSRDFDRTTYYRFFAPVFQDIYIFPETINANIAGDSVYNSNQVTEVIQKSGLSAYIESLPDKGATQLFKTSRSGAIDLSGGLNQKVLLARALYKDAPINVLDEPTAALDPVAESELYSAFDAISREKTSIFISHRLASTQFCDRIVYLENGAVIEEGSHQSLMAKGGHYRALYDVQSRYYKRGGMSK